MTMIADYVGMDANTGRAVAGKAHLAQSISILLTTPLKTRVMRRDVGSALFDLIDSNVDGTSLIDFHHANAEAIERFEPRVRIRQARLASTEAELVAGQVALDMSLTDRQTGEPVKLSGVAL